MCFKAVFQDFWAVRMQRIRIRKTELRLWTQEQRPMNGVMDKYTTARARVDLSPGRKTEHFLKAARIVSTLVADAIALQLRELLSADGLR